MSIDKSLLAGGKIIGGGPTPAPPLVMRTQDGSLLLFSQVAVAALPDSIVAQLGTYIARVAACEVIGVLEDESVLPKGALQRYQDALAEGDKKAQEQKS